MPIRPIPFAGFLGSLLPALIVLVALQSPYAAWEMIPKPAGMPQFGTIVVGPGGNLYSFRYGTVWHSTDRGASFQKSPMTITIDGTAVDTNSLSGAFTPVATPSGSMFQSRSGSVRKAVIRSRDHGKTWTSVGDAQGVAGTRLLASPKGEIYAADMFNNEFDNDTVWISRDDGDSWSQAGIFERIMSMAVDPEGSVFLIGYRVGDVHRNGRYILFKTSDGGAHWDSLGAPYGRAGEPVLSANRKGCLAVAFSRDLWTSVPSDPTLTLSADTGAYTETDTQILFTPQHRLLIAVELRGVLEFTPPFASHASLNRGLGRDSTAIFDDMQYDDQDNLYMTARQPAYPDVNLYVFKASNAGIRTSALRIPVRSTSQSVDLTGRLLPSKSRAWIVRAGIPPQ